MARPSVLNISKFSRLVSGDNPQNIRDHELAELTNAYVTPQFTIKGRKGYNKIADIASTNFIDAIKKVTWSDSSTDFYVFKDGEMGTVDETDGSYTKLIDVTGGKRDYVQAWKDNLVFLRPSLKPKKFKKGDSSSYELLEPIVGYWSEPKYIAPAADSDSELKVGNYLYSVSLGFGDYNTNTKYGESYLSFVPADDNVNFTAYTENDTYGDGEYKAEGSISLLLYRYGWDLVSVTLWRKYCSDWGSSNNSLYIKDEESWEPIDYAEITSADVSSVSYNDPVTGVITNITGTIYSLFVTFSDNGTKHFSTTEYPVGSEPYTRSDIITDIKAKHMERWGNRLVFANITNEDYGAKKFYFTYRGFIKGISELAGGSQYEIPGFAYEDPMPVVAANSYGWVDQYNVEDEIKGVKAVRDTLYIFTERRMFKFKEGYPEPQMITDNVGCVAQYSIQEVDGTLIWLDRDGVYTYDGNKIDKISHREIDSYIENIDTDKYIYYPSIMFERKYWLAVDVNGTPTVLVYDFQTQSWHTREYQCDSTAGKIDWFCKWDGNLYAGIKSTSVACDLVQLETGHTDNDDAIDITIGFKAFDMGNPQYSKLFRVVYLDMVDLPGSITLETYIDDYTNTNQSIDIELDVGGFVLGDATSAVLGTGTLVSYTDELIGVSLARGSYGSRMQPKITVSGISNDTELRTIGIDYFLKRNAKLKYGG